MKKFLFAVILTVSAVCVNAQNISTRALDSLELFYRITNNARVTDSLSALQQMAGFKNSFYSGSLIKTVMFLGDSRVEHKRVSEPLRRQMVRNFGNAGIGCFINWDYYPLGISAANNSTGNTFTALDQSGDATYCFYGKAVSLNTTQAATGATWFETTQDSFGLVKSIDVYTLNKSGGGTMEVKIIDKYTGSTLLTQNISTSAGSTTLAKTTLTLTKAQNNVRVEYKSVSGTVIVMTFVLKSGNNGVLFLSAGNGSSKISEFQNWNTSTIGTFWATNLKPNLLITLMGVNDANLGNSTEQNPKNMKTSLEGIINSYKNTVGERYFTAVVLGETGERITSEFEDRINSAFYNISLSTANKNNVMFVNLKDITPDWGAYAQIPTWTWTTGDNVHWGIRGGLAAGAYIYSRIFSTRADQSTLFPRRYMAHNLASVASYDVSTNAPTLGTNLFDTELSLYQPLNKVRVVANGIERTYSATAIPFGWSYSTNTITVYDSAGSVENMKSLIVEILP